MSSLANYFHTLRYLRPVQIVGRIRFALYRPRPEQRAAPPPRVTINPYASPIPAATSMLGADRFRFLNVEGACARAADWAGGGRPPLWSYNLHYFDDLNAAQASTRRAWHEALIERWINENPAATGIGWDPYPVSRRTVNWIKWSLAGNLLSPTMRHSLAVQTRWLTHRIESHLQGNHVFANAKALIHAGLYFSGEEAEGWLRQGLSIMRREISEQVLPDGGHFELSTMYHAATLEDLLDTANIMQAYGYTADPAWRDSIARMAMWLDTMSHPDAQIAFFNDAAFGVSPQSCQLRDYAARLNILLEPRSGTALQRLIPSGYVAADVPPFYLLCDVAAVGPDHLPAHAHADTLSFELSCLGRRVFVNSGTSEYGLGAERRRQRGTAAHNTLVLDGQDSSEVWAGFRVARRARARSLDARAENSVVTIVGEHDGYRRLPGRNLHRRRWTLSAQELIIEDAVEGPFRSADCHFHLHPDIAVRRGSGSLLHLEDPKGPLLEMQFEGAAEVDVADSTWHPQFGLALPSRSIIARLDGPQLRTRIRRSAVI